MHRFAFFIEDRVNAEGHGLLDVWMSHGDRVVELPPGFKAIASTPDLPIGGMADEDRGYYALQFHPEVTHTRQGTRMYERFLREICGCEASWNPGNIIDDAIARVRAQVGQGRVLLGLSGGVDSSVVAALLHKAIGEQLVCVFVDHGLLRLGEGDAVMDIFARNPDAIESAGSKTGKAHVIKSHHNVGGLPAHMKLKLVEPLRELFKDEVRRIVNEVKGVSRVVYDISGKPPATIEWE